MSVELPFSTGDRVKQSGSDGPRGTVQKVRVETVRKSIKQKAELPGITVTVLWDNGTTSHFIPNGLEKA